ncbi:MAG: metallophosphoesterase [Cytophagales bacterium]|nr:metallophosphoesterase [Cytophagales bacterium]
MNRFVLLVYFFFPAIGSFSQSLDIIRGPYLNSVSSTSAVIRWRTEKPTDSKVSFSTNRIKVERASVVSEAELKTDHELTISGLSPATKYFYSVGAITAKPKMYEDQFLVTAPPVGSTSPLRIWALGDFGDGSKNQLNCRDAIIKETIDQRPDAWLWLGDNAYNIGLDEEYQRHVFRVYQESFFKNTNLYPSPGNHDYGKAKRNPTDV